MSKTIRVLLADDHAVVRQGIRQFLEEADDIEVIAEAENGVEAVQMVESLQPDVAVLDIRMPEATGVEAARQIKERFSQVRILILTAYDDDPYVFALLQAGADGYVLKTASGEELIGAVRSVHQGETALSPKIAAKLVRQMAARRADGTFNQDDSLTQRELDVIRLAARGMTNRGIGQKLGISHRTVQGHLASIYAKMNVNSRTEAVTEALRRGWIIID